MKLIRLLLYSLLFLLPLGQFSRIPIGFGANVNIYLNDLILPIMIFLWLGWSLGVRKKLELPPFSNLIFLFVGICALSLVNGLYWVGLKQAMVASLYLWRWVMYAGLYFVVYDLIQGTRYKVQGTRRLPITIVQFLIAGVVVFAIIGLLQFVFFPDFSRMVQHGWDPHFYRVLSTFFDPNFAGIFMVLGLILIVSMIVCNGVKKKHLFLVPCSLFLVPAIILTFSRSTYLALITGGMLLGILKSRKFLFLLLLMLFLSFAFIPRVRTRVIGALNLDVTARARIEDWEKTFKIIEDNWLLGVGFNTFRYAQERYGYFRDERGVNQPGGHAGAGADNSLLFVWATTGIFGILTYLALLFGIWWKGFKRYKGYKGVNGEKERKEGKALSCALNLTIVAGLPALVAHSQFVNSLFYPWIMEWMWIIAALSAAGENPKS